MADVARIPRRRGGLCGLLLIVLGAWGALAPFIGPYFSFAFTPDKSWAYTTGRLYLSVVPGAAAVLGGLLILATRSRAVGFFGGLLAAAGGAWFIVGDGIVTAVLKKTSISPGTPLPHSSGGIPSATWTFLEQLGFFSGVGILVLFFGALAIGRFSMVSARDAEAADEVDYDSYSDSAAPLPASSQYPSSASQFPTTSGQFPAASSFPGSTKPFPGDEPTETQARFPAPTGQFPTSPSGQFPESSAPPFPAGKE
jgi:hypothetical protein